MTTNYIEEKIKEFEEKYPYGLMDLKHTKLSLTDEVKSFLRSSLEGAYTDGRADEAVGCETHIQKALTNQLEDIKGKVEGMKSLTPTFSIEEAIDGQNSGDIADVASRDGWNDALTEVLALLNEK